MKQLVLLLFSMLCFSAEAQVPSYHPFVEDGKVWRYEGSNPNSAPEYYETWVRTYWLEGDTVIGNYRCHKLYLKNTYTHNKIERSYCGALFEDGAQVFHIWPNSETPYLLYDFSCKKGDDVTIWGTKLTISDRFNVQFNESSYVVLKWCLSDEVESIYKIFDSICIDGVGDPSGLIDFIDSWYPDSYRYKLLSCEVKGEVVFDYQSFQKTMAVCQPFLETCDSPSSPHNGQYFDLTGRRIPDTQALGSRHGVFIKNGKKILR